jgi:hypothetical protein
MKLLLEALAHSVDRDLGKRLDIARERSEELLFDRPRLRPILEPNKAGVRINQFFARPIEQRDGFRLELVHSEPGGRIDLHDPEILSADICPTCCRKCRQSQKEGGRTNAPHGDVFHQKRRLPQM